MKKKDLILKFTNSDKEFLFEDRVFLIEDKNLIEILDRPSIKNGDAPLVMKTLGSLHISDVLQVKINLSETGYFLASFRKEAFSEQRRQALLDAISTLKSKAVQTNSTQLKKTKKLVAILNKYHPIYVTFVNDGIYKVNVTKVSAEELKFPLLVLKKPERKFMFKAPATKKEVVIKEEPLEKVKEEVVEKPKEKVIERPKQKEKPHKVAVQKPANKPKKVVKYSPFPLYDVDYLFVMLFTALGAFAITTSVFELMNKESIAVFLTILSVAFVIVLNLSVQGTLYKKYEVKNPYLRYYLLIFIALGIVGGIIGGYFVDKDVFKTEIEDFNYKKMIIISSSVSCVALLSAVSGSRLVNLLLKKIRKIR